MSRPLISNGLLILLLLAVGVLSYGAYSEKPEASALYTPQVPLNIADWWSMQDIRFSEDTYQILETRDVLARLYHHPTRGDAQLTLVYSLWNRKVVHPPELCLRGAGWQETSRDLVPLPGNALTQAHRLILTQGTQRQLVLYWYKVGSHYTTNYLAHQLTIVWNTLLHRTAGVALVRIMTAMAPGETPAAATERIQDFALALAPTLNHVLP